jgi:hypothetical protein
VLHSFRFALPRLNRSLVIWAVILPLSSPFFAFAGGEGSVRGFVSDSTNGEPLVFATVALKGLGRGTSTDIKGYFYIPGVPPGDYMLGVSLVGYRHASIPVKVAEGEITHVAIRLQPGKIELEGLTVVHDRGVRPTDREVGLHQISAREINVTPINTEADMFRVVQATPGVTTTGDVTARYYVRGGAGDQNLLLVDGVTIYSPFHALGVLSVVDPEIISGIEFHKGGFGPELGGRLSSILNVQTRDGNKMRFGGAAQASLLTGKCSIEGPIPHGSFLVAGRKSIFPKSLERFLTSADAPFDFYDCSFKATYSNPDFDENGTLSLHGFLSADRVKNDDPFREDYAVKNIAGGLDWSKVWHSPLRSSVRLAYSGFDAEVLPKESGAVPRSNTVRDVTLSIDAAYMYSNRDELQFGIEAKSLSTKYVMENLLRVQRAYDVSAWDVVAYVNYHFLRWELFGLDIGIRMHPMQLSLYGPQLFEPRFRASYSLTPTLIVHAAAGWYSQEVTTLMNEADVIAVFEPWVIVPEYLRSPEAAHFVAGIQYDLTPEISLDLDAYIKPMQNLIETNERKFTAGAYDFTNVTGKAEGFESSLRYTTEAVLLQAAYTLSWTHLDIGGVRYTPRYDVRHVLNLTAAVELGDGWQASAFWSLHSGFPFTPISGFYDRVLLSTTNPTNILRGAEAVTAWGERNSQRLPAYHRLDVSCAKRFAWDPVRMSVGVSVVNVYDRKNIFYLDRTTGENIYMLRFAPSFVVKVEL